MRHFDIGFYFHKGNLGKSLDKMEIYKNIRLGHNKKRSVTKQNISGFRKRKRHTDADNIIHLPDSINM